MWRGEAKLEALRQKDGYSTSFLSTQSEEKLGGEDTFGSSPSRNDMFHFIDDEDEPQNKAVGEEMWRKEIERRFVAGRDEDFEEYDDVDGGKWDDGAEEEREEEEKWFDEEEERWVSEDLDDDDGKLGKERGLKGETGVQDF